MSPRDQLLARLRDPNAKQAFHYLRIDEPGVFDLSIDHDASS